MITILLLVVFVIVLLILTSAAALLLGFEQQIPAICALALSTGLFIIKMVEVWNNQLRIDAAATTTSDIHEGHVIRVRNLSNRTFIITHWALLKASRWERKKTAAVICDAEYDSGDHRMDPYSTFALKFADGDYFSVSENALGNKKIYLRIYIAGRKSVVRCVYPF